MAANIQSPDLLQTYKMGLIETLQLLNMQDRNRLLMDKDFTDKVIRYLSCYHQLVDHISSPDLRYACVKDIAKQLQSHRLAKGDIFLSQGESFSRFYLLIEGELQCFDHKQPDLLNEEFIHQKSIIAAEEFLQQQKNNLSTQFEGFKGVEASNESIQIALKHLQSLQTPLEQLELLKQHRHLFRLQGKVCLFKAIESDRSRIQPFTTFGCFFEAQQTSQYLLIASKDTTIAYLDEEIYKRIFATLREQFYFIGKALERIFLFSSGFNKRAIRDIGVIFRERVVKGVIYTAADPAKEIFIVKKGIVTLTKNQVKVAEIQSGKIFGHEDVKEYVSLNGGSKRSSVACSGCNKDRSCSSSNSECLKSNNNGFSSCKNKSTNILGNSNPRILSAATKGGSICTLLCADIAVLRQNIRKEFVYSLFQAGAMKLKQYDQKYFKQGQSKKQQLSLEDTLLKIKKSEGEQRFNVQGEILDSQYMSSSPGSSLLFSRILQRTENTNKLSGEKMFKRYDSQEKYNTSSLQSACSAQAIGGSVEEVKSLGVDKTQKSKDGYLFADTSLARKIAGSKTIFEGKIHQEKVEELTESLDSSIAARLGASSGSTDNCSTAKELTESNRVQERIRQSSPLGIKTRMTRAGVAKMISNVNSTMNQRRSSSFSQITQQQSNSKLIYNPTNNNSNNSLHCGNNQTSMNSVDSRYQEQRLSWEVVGTPLSAQTDIVQKRFRNSFGFAEKTQNLSSVQKNAMQSDKNKNLKPTTAQNTAPISVLNIISDSVIFPKAAAGAASPPQTACENELLDEEQFPSLLVSRYSFSGQKTPNIEQTANSLSQDRPPTSIPGENLKKKDIFKKSNLHITLDPQGEEAIFNKGTYFSPSRELAGSPCLEQISKNASLSTSSKFKRKIHSVFSRNPQPSSQCSPEKLRDSSQTTAQDPTRSFLQAKRQGSFQNTKKSRAELEGPKTRKRYRLQQQLFRNSLLTHHLEELSEIKETSAPLLRITSSAHQTQIRGSSSSSSRNHRQGAHKNLGSQLSEETYPTQAPQLKMQPMLFYYQESTSILTQNKKSDHSLQGNFEDSY